MCCLIYQLALATEKKKIKQEASTNLESSSFSSSSWAPYSFPTGPLLFAPHVGVLVMLQTHLRQTSCSRRSLVLAAPPKNRDRISFFLPKTPRFK